MEILTSNRWVTIDSREVLGQEEANALAAVPEGQEELIRREYAGRREALGELQQFGFAVDPPDFLNQMQAMDFARKHGLWDGTAKMSPLAFSLLMLLQRINGWEGFEVQGQPLACTPENKVLVFGQAFTVIQTLARKLADLEAAEAKNSGTSAPGSNGPKPSGKPAGPAPRRTRK